MSMFQKATKRNIKARVAFDGPSGSGKTWTALEWATVMGKRIALIDTERSSAGLYSDRFDFDTADFAPPYDPARLGKMLKAAESEGYEVIVIDSLSHFWEGEGGVLDIVDSAGQRAQGNSFAGWKVGTPALRHLVDTMLGLDAHLIVTMRSKMEYVLEEDSRGKKVPRKVGMAPVMRAGVEYEFTLVGDIDLEHRVVISKSRCHLLADEVLQPGRASEGAEAFKGWLESGESVAQRSDVDELTERINELPEERRKICKRLFVECFGRPENLLASRLDEARAFVAEYEKEPEPEPPKAEVPNPNAGTPTAPEAAATNGTKVKTPSYAKDLHIRASKVFDGDKSKVADAKLDALVLNVTGGRTTSTGALTESEAASVATWLNDVQDGRVRVEAEDPAEGVTLWIGETPIFFPRSDEGVLVPAEPPPF